MGLFLQLVRPLNRTLVSALLTAFLCIGGWGPSAVEVAASPPAIRLGPKLALKLHQAPDHGAVRANVGLDLGGRLANGGQVDAEQLRTPLQRRRDRPTQIGIVPGPHKQ